MLHPRLVPGLPATVLCVLASCRSAGDHFRESAWHDGFVQLSSDRKQWVPAAAAIAATPLLLLNDRSTSTESIEDKYFGTKTRYGDELTLGLGFAPIALGAFNGLGSGDTRYLEVASEATLLAALETQFLKVVTGRGRPNGSPSNDSFPSGHTSFAFGGATLLARWWEREHDGSALGYWLYVPAAYVGITRLEGGRHFLSDITFGAALGMLTSNLVWNAHFGDESHPGIFGPRVRTTLQPIAAPDRIGLSLTFSF